MLHGVASSHGFNDGNKRTTWLLTELLFKRCGYVLQLGESDRLDDVVVAVVEGDNVAGWSGNLVEGTHREMLIV